MNKCLVTKLNCVVDKNLPLFDKVVFKLAPTTTGSSLILGGKDAIVTFTGTLVDYLGSVTYTSPFTIPDNNTTLFKAKLSNGEDVRNIVISNIQKIKSLEWNPKGTEDRKNIADLAVLNNANRIGLTSSMVSSNILYGNIEDFVSLAVTYGRSVNINFSGKNIQLNNQIADVASDYERYLDFTSTPGIVNVYNGRNNTGNIIATYNITSKNWHYNS